MEIDEAVGVVLVMLAGVAVGAWLQRGHPTVRAVEHRLTALATQVDGWQRTHDVHQDELDRRLERLEEVAARAENEIRMLSGLLSRQTAAPPNTQQLAPHAELSRPT